MVCNLNLVQTYIEEKKSIAEQFANVVQRRTSLDAANGPLIQKRDELGQQIANWHAERHTITVSEV